MKFLVDGMLGRLAHWLRMLGQDVHYARDISDTELLQLAKKEQRIILTSDVELYRRARYRGIECLLIKNTDRTKTLAMLSQRFGIPLEIDVSTSRCPKCNSPIEPVPKEQIKGLIPEKSWKMHNEFWRCKGCGQIYWTGSHWKKIKETLRKAKEIKNQQNKQ